MSLSALGVIVDYDYLLSKVKTVGIHKVRKIFTIVTLGHNNTRKTISSFKLVSIVKKDGGADKKVKIVILPRFGGFMLQESGILGTIKNKLQTGNDVKWTNSKLIPTDNQKTVLAYLLKNIYNSNNITSGKSSTTLQMDPGYGKTYLALSLIPVIGKKTFIIVPNTYLLRQWTQILQDVFPDNTVGCYYGKKKQDGDVIVAVVNSAIKYKKYSECGLIIYDESHMYCSPKFATVFALAQAACCLGITATPNDRIDKFDPVAHWSLGPVISAENIPGWDAARMHFTAEVTRVIYDGHKDYIQNIVSAAGIVSVPLMVNQLEDDPYRNALIIAYAIKLYKMGRDVFIFSDRRNHLHKLAAILQECKIDYDAPEIEPKVTTASSNSKTKPNVKIKGITKLMGGATDEEIETAKTTGRIIMTTFQYSGTGVSINKMNSLIMATPRKSNMKQILGRIFRMGSDQTIVRHIIDIVDNKICLKSQYTVRKKTYISLKATIKDHKIKWQNCSKTMTV
jgi:superfamily II DNA or RNA helicase